MKNFLIGILIAAIIIGTGFGVKWEVDSFNAKYNTPIEDQLKEVEEETVDDSQNSEELEDGCVVCDDEGGICCPSDEGTK